MYIALIILLNALVIAIILLIKKKNKQKFLFKDYILLLFVGGLSAALAYVFNTIGQDFLRIIFRGAFIFQDGVAYWRNGLYEILYYLVYYFFIVGIVEELAKNLVPLIMCKNNEKRSSTSLDCILNFMIVACTFSCIEDYLYIKNGTPGFLRLMTVLSGHLLYSLIFCKSFIKYKIRDKAYSIGSLIKHKTWKTEGNETLKNFNIKFNNAHYLRNSFLFAILCHAVYNFNMYIFTNTPIMIYIIIIHLNALFIVLFIFELKKMRNLEQEGINLFIKSYPYYTREKLIELEIIQE